jgi:phosphoglycolate phosphatase-like HAD superfamily hydrolase
LVDRVVLFDIDGTVLTFEGAQPGPGRAALERAMHELYALEGATDGMRLAGGTDRAVVRAMLARAGASTDDAAIARVLSSYLAHLTVILQTRAYRPIGDVASTVAQLRARSAVVGLATGNIRGGARLKLASAGLEATFDFALGGFGCDAEPREEIVRLAAARCHAAQGSSVVVVGDTQSDVLAGRALGARVIGVAADARSRAELELAGADVIVEACGDELVRAALG